MTDISGPDFITILVSNLEISYNFYKQKGVPIIDELRSGPFGMTFSFKDPDDYIMTVHDRG